MIKYFYQLSDLSLFSLLGLTAIIGSFIAIIFVRHVVPVTLRYRDNTVVGNISAVIGVIYGVLVGLTALYLFNNNTYTTDAVQRESNAVANLYRDSKWLENPARDSIRDQLSQYINNAISVEWPLMKMGEDLNKDGVNFIENISNEIRKYKISSNRDLLIIHDLLVEVKSLYNARVQRIEISSMRLGPEIWAVILIGTILTVGINFLFKMNFYLHLVTASAAGLMAASMVFLILTLDRPFQGEFVIEPTGLQDVLDLMKSEQKT